MSQIRSRENSLKEEARKAKARIKGGFWLQCQKERDSHLERARENGVNESKAGRYFAERVCERIEGKTEDDFYLRVKQMLLEEGEVSDAIGRLTDKPYFDTLSYEERQRYTLSISEKYLRALERFRRECPFDALQAGQKGE
jgi:hypothetical protein